MRTLKALLRAPRIVLAVAAMLAALAVVVIAVTVRTLLRDAGPALWTTLVVAAAAAVTILLGLAYQHRVWVRLVTIVARKLRASLPVWERELDICGLDKPVVVTVDRYGIPTIRAQSQRDAMCALGFVTARDRFFQMDMLRRHAAGRMSEMFGRATLNLDIASRELGFSRVAAEIVRQLPERQREALHSYTHGVNAFLSTKKSRPFEFSLLNCEPESWSTEDSVLVELQMFRMLCGDESSERMLTIMHETLPGEVCAFLTPDEGRDETILAGGPESHRPATDPPTAALALLLQHAASGEPPLRPLVSVDSAVAGSNHWALAKSRTKHGAALLANDLHLAPTVPNEWYRVRIAFNAVDCCGVVLPGVPIIVAGSNGHVAWGVTNAAADCLDLVGLEVNPANDGEYRCAGRWQPFETIVETIQVKGEAAVAHSVRTTIWGPVSPTPLLGRPVAIHWTALDPACVDLGLIDMNGATSLEESVAVANRFAGPPMNVLIADARGRIAWTMCGRLPVRHDVDGAISAGWSDGVRGWRGFVPPDELPRAIDPPSGVLATANNRTTGTGYGPAPGFHFSNRCRIDRIYQLLATADRVSEQDMLAMQMDTDAAIYAFYQQLALDVLTADVLAARPRLRRLRQQVEAWNGRADRGSHGLALLTTFRDELGRAVIGPLVTRCRAADPGFTYSWANIDTPLRRLLTDRIPALLPDAAGHASWESFIVARLEACAVRLALQQDSRWRSVNRIAIAHPLARAVPPLGPLLNMRTAPLPGCLHSVCVASPALTASMRMVVSPVRHDAAILHMPCGQSGHPLSRHYDDQHETWIAGSPLQFLPGGAVATVTLNPVAPATHPAARPLHV